MYERRRNTDSLSSALSVAPLVCLFYAPWDCTRAIYVILFQYIHTIQDGKDHASLTHWPNLHERGYANYYSAVIAVIISGKTSYNKEIYISGD
jgi:hypothetical protein